MILMINIPYIINQWLWWFISITSPFHKTFQESARWVKDNVFCTVLISVQFAVNGQQCEDALLARLVVGWGATRFNQPTSGSLLVVWWLNQQSFWEPTNLLNQHCGNMKVGMEWAKVANHGENRWISTEKTHWDSVDHGQQFQGHTMTWPIPKCESWNTKG